MNLEEGMYVRIQELNEVIIVKILKVEDDGFNADDNMYYMFSEVIKASHNIIDLIEIGDYVNGCRVIKINLESPLKYVKCINDNCFEEKEIKTILTKKQMENNCYRIDD